MASPSEILGTQEGIEALVEFIRASGAFTQSGKPPLEPAPPPYEPYVTDPTRRWTDDYDDPNNDHG